MASGIRYDLLLNDKKHCMNYIQELAKYHTSGQLKVAPEHIAPNTLKLMGKPQVKSLMNFKHIFSAIERSTYSGWVGAEYKPVGTTNESLDWFS